MSAAITTLKPHKGKTWILTLSNGETHFLNGEIAAQFHLHQGDLLTEEQLEQVLTAEQTRKAYQRALYLLDIRAYSYQELFQKLEATYPESVCYAVLDKLAGLNLINDARYAEALARHYVEVKHLGCAGAICHAPAWHFQGTCRRGTGTLRRPYAGTVLHNINQKIQPPADRSGGSQSHRKSKGWHGKAGI